jgi:hypothetical protein
LSGVSIDGKWGCRRSSWATWVSEKKPVRAIEVRVGEPDLAGASRAATGRPGHHPRLLLKLCVHSQLNQTASSRTLALGAASS